MPSKKKKNKKQKNKNKNKNKNINDKMTIHLIDVPPKALHSSILTKWSFKCFVFAN